jgi:Tfp pilus assembly protein PilV
MRISPSKTRFAGTTLTEVLVAAAIVGVFFISIFEVNAVCLRYVQASKESVGAIQGVQDRLEGLRNLSFDNLISTSYMTAAQPTPAPSGAVPVSLYYPSNTSDLAARVTETVTVSAYPSGNPTVTYTRNPGSGVTPTASPASVDFSTSTLVKVDVTYSWNMTLGGRARTAGASTILSSGTKK